MTNREEDVPGCGCAVGRVLGDGDAAGAERVERRGGVGRARVERGRAHPRGERGGRDGGGRAERAAERHGVCGSSGRGCERTHECPHGSVHGGWRCRGAACDDAEHSGRERRVVADALGVGLDDGAQEAHHPALCLWRRIMCCVSERGEGGGSWHEKGRKNKENTLAQTGRSRWRGAQRRW